jgi:hypothetical protein
MPMRAPADERACLNADVYRLRLGRFEEMTDTVDKRIFPVRWQTSKAVQQMPVDFTGVQLGGVAISAATIPGEVRASTMERGGYHVVLTTAGQLRSEHRSVQVPVSPELAAVHLPSGPATLS